MDIHGLLKEADKVKGRESDDLIKVLSQLQYMLMHGDEGVGLEDVNNAELRGRVKKTLEYLEVVPLAISQGSFFGSSKMRLGEVLQNNNSKVVAQTKEHFNEAKKKYSGIPLLPKKFQPLLMQFQKSLMKGYQTAWEFSYPHNQQGEVVNEAVRQWQAIQTPLGENDAALVDFKRRVTLQGRSVEEDDLAHKLVKHMVVSARAYDSEERGLLAAWLNNNGGQGNNFIFPLLLTNNHLLANRAGNESDMYLPGEMKPSIQNWFVENGKIFYQYEAEATSLIRRSADGDSYIQMANGVGVELKSMPNRNAEVDPLLKVSTKIRLDVERNNETNQLMVKPKVVDVSLESYTDYIRAPDLGAQQKVLEVPQVARRHSF